MTPKIKIRSHMYPGYGSALGGYHVRVTWQNVLLDEERGGTSEVDMGIAIAEMRAKWLKRPWTDEKFAAAVEGKPQASPPCDHCGGDTLDGGSSVRDKVFCNRCQKFIQPYIDACREADARRQAEFQAQQEDREHNERAQVTEAVAASFHWRDGWHFKRLPDGGVRLMHPGETGRWLDTDLTIPPNEWASIVASMSAAGETGETYRAALAAQSPMVH